MNFTKDYLHTLFEYKDGELFRKVSKGASKKGSKAGTKKPDGCSHVRIESGTYLLHRVIFMMHYGYVPDQIDHIDGNRSNNRIENLRPATHSQNAQNAKTRKDNLFGIKNVSFSKRTNKWKVRIQANKKRLFIGAFDNLELAELVAMEARDKYHGQYAKYGVLMSPEQAKAYVATLP